MSSIVATANTELYYLVVPVVLLILARISWRTFASYKGTAFSRGKTVAYTVVYVGLGTLFSVLSFFEGVSYTLALLELILVGAAALWSYKYTDSRISFWKTDDGRLFFKGGVVIYLIYLGGFLTRLLIDVAFIGPLMFDFGSIGQLSGVAIYGSMATDLLLTLGVGLLIGRNVRVSERHGRIMRGEEQVPIAPIPRGGLVSTKPDLLHR